MFLAAFCVLRVFVFFSFRRFSATRAACFMFQALRAKQFVAILATGHAPATVGIPAARTVFQTVGAIRGFTGIAGRRTVPTQALPAVLTRGAVFFVRKTTTVATGNYKPVIEFYVRTVGVVGGQDLAHEQKGIENPTR